MSKLSSVESLKKSSSICGLTVITARNGYFLDLKFIRPARIKLTGSRRNLFAIPHHLITSEANFKIYCLFNLSTCGLLSKNMFENQAMMMKIGSVFLFPTHKAYLKAATWKRITLELHESTKLKSYWTFIDINYANRRSLLAVLFIYLFEKSLLFFKLYNVLVQLATSDQPI